MPLRAVTHHVGLSATLPRQQHLRRWHMPLRAITRHSRHPRAPAPTSGPAPALAPAPVAPTLALTLVPALALAPTLAKTLAGRSLGAIVLQEDED